MPDLQLIQPEKLAPTNKTNTDEKRQQLRNFIAAKEAASEVGPPTLQNYYHCNNNNNNKTIFSSATKAKARRETAQCSMQVEHGRIKAQETTRGGGGAYTGRGGGMGGAAA